MYKKIKLYIVSLWFLFLLLFIVKIDIPICFKPECKFIGFESLIQNNKIAIFSLTFMILGAIYYFNFNREVSVGAPLLPKKVILLKNLHSEVLSFLATYIIPLVCLDMDKSRSFPILILLLVLIGWIYVRTNLFYTNPTLAILGFKVYQVDTESYPEMIVIIKNSLSVGDYILPRQINGNVFFAKKIKTNKPNDTTTTK